MFDDSFTIFGEYHQIYKWERRVESDFRALIPSVFRLPLTLPPSNHTTAKHVGMWIYFAIMASPKLDLRVRRHTKSGKRKTRVKARRVFRRSFRSLAAKERPNFSSKWTFRSQSSCPTTPSPFTSNSPNLTRRSGLSLYLTVRGTLGVAPREPQATSTRAESLF